MESVREYLPGELRVLMNHIYEYNKGVRCMILCTLNKKYERVAVHQLQSQDICYIVQSVGNRCINIFFGKPECMDIVRMMIKRSLSSLTPEEDFILGALLGYDICQQCKRYCSRKRKNLVKN